MEFSTIEPYFGAILKDLHSHGLLFVEATGRQVREAYNRVRANGKKADTSRLSVHKRGYGLL